MKRVISLFYNPGNSGYSKFTSNSGTFEFSVREVINFEIVCAFISSSGYGKKKVCISSFVKSLFIQPISNSLGSITGIRSLPL
jgi:hypothetical protein